MYKGPYNASNLFNITSNFRNGRHVLRREGEEEAARFALWGIKFDEWILAADLIPAQFSARPFQTVTAQVCKLNGSWSADLCYTGIFYRPYNAADMDAFSDPPIFRSKSYVYTGVLHAGSEVYKSYSFTSYVKTGLRRKSEVVAWKASEEAAGNKRDGGMTYATTANNANELTPRILSDANLYLSFSLPLLLGKSSMLKKNRGYKIQHVIASLRARHRILYAISRNYYIRRIIWYDIWTKMWNKNVNDNKTVKWKSKYAAFTFMRKNNMFVWSFLYAFLAVFNTSFNV